jgi:hypothetical protein
MYFHLSSPQTWASPTQQSYNQKCFVKVSPFSTILSMFSIEEQSLILNFTLCINPPFATTPSS